MQDKNKKPEEETLEETKVTGSQQPDELEAQAATTGSGDAKEEEGDKPSHSFVHRLTNHANIYLIAFMLVLLAAGGAVLALVKFGGNDGSNRPNSKAQSLTDEQLAQLKGSTTVVGDPQQILDIQGSSVFEGQVLMRNNLDVAGSIKVGGSLSLPAITVGGTSSFGQIQVNDTLSVSGSTILGQATVQRSLSVAGGLSVSGTFSANQINVSNLQLTGDLQISRHITLGGPTPGRSNGPSLGGGGTVSLSGTDTAGTITINTGSTPPAGCFVTVNFVNRFNSTPRVVISPSNAGAGSLQYYTNRSTTAFSVCTNNAPAPSANYIFDYIIID